MKVYEIIDAEESLTIGCILYFEREKSCIIELQDYLDEWTAPLIFANTVKNGTFTIGRELSGLWVRERVIPSGRQNIDSILANARLSKYDEMALLEKSDGKCSQDNLYIKKIPEIPKYVIERMQHNLVEFVTCDNYSVLCFFADGLVRKVELSSLSMLPEVRKIISNEKLFSSGHIAAGGYCVTFNDSIDIGAEVLYRSGTVIPLSLDNFVSFVNSNVVDTSECCDILECSRQNLANYISKNILFPIKRDTKGNLYTKGNVYRNEVIAMRDIY